MAAINALLFFDGGQPGAYTVCVGGSSKGEGMHPVPGTYTVCVEQWGWDAPSAVVPQHVSATRNTHPTSPDATYRGCVPALQCCAPDHSQLP